MTDGGRGRVVGAGGERQRGLLWLLLVVSGLPLPGCSLSRPLLSLTADTTAPRCALDQSIACFERANEAHAGRHAACVDWYFESARWAWCALDELCDDPVLAAAARRQYNTSVERFIFRAQQYHRLRMPDGVDVRCGEQWQVVSLSALGFPWNAAEFAHVLPPPDDLDSRLRRRYTREGIGVPLVVQRCRNPLDPREQRFFPHKSAFAATAMLRFDTGPRPTLNFYDPLRIADIQLAAGSAALAADLTAPISVQLEASPTTWLAGFLQPSEVEGRSGLLFWEPYQPGKIPLIYVHGLLSDPQSGADLANDLRAKPGFADQYQIWMFRYPTGQGFLRSAAQLRDEITAAVAAYDPECRDPALQQIVLAGHSMGGLLSKLQVTHSGELLWDTVSRVPLEALQAPEWLRSELARALYFDPQPHVSRVIFIATPHCGAAAAAGAAGLFSSSLIRQPTQQEREYELLVQNNPGALAPFVRQRLPTSLDMLRPDSPLLAAVRRLPIRSGVTLHTILGTGYPGLLTGPSDGIVPARSAIHPGVASELRLPACHTKIEHRLDVANEIARILHEHAAHMTANCQSSSPWPPTEALQPLVPDELQPWSGEHPPLEELPLPTF